MHSAFVSAGTTTAHGEGKSPKFRSSLSARAAARRSQAETECRRTLSVNGAADNLTVNIVKHREFPSLEMPPGARVSVPVDFPRWWIQRRISVGSLKSPTRLANGTAKLKSPMRPRPYRHSYHSSGRLDEGTLSVPDFVAFQIRSADSPHFSLVTRRTEGTFRRFSGSSGSFRHSPVPLSPQFLYFPFCTLRETSSASRSRSPGRTKTGLTPTRGGAAASLLHIPHPGR